MWSIDFRRAYLHLRDLQTSSALYPTFSFRMKILFLERPMVALSPGSEGWHGVWDMISFLCTRPLSTLLSTKPRDDYQRHYDAHVWIQSTFKPDTILNHQFRHLCNISIGKFLCLRLSLLSSP